MSINASLTWGKREFGSEEAERSLSRDEAGDDGERWTGKLIEDDEADGDRGVDDLVILKRLADEDDPCKKFDGIMTEFLLLDDSVDGWWNPDRILRGML